MKQAFKRVKPRDLLGERGKEGLRLQFDPSVKLEFHGARISSDGGLLLFRELDEVLGLTKLAGTFLQDFRAGAKYRHTMTALLRQAVFGRLAGYEDTNDAERLRVDPTMRQIVGGRARKHLAASTSQMSRFETEILSSDANVQALANLTGRWIIGSQSAFHDKGFDPGHGQLGKSDPRPPGRFCLERSFRMHLLSSAVLLQPVWGSGAGHAEQGQRA